ncbi:MAG: class I SAM-dependent methyltransferase [Phycisphaeraceae bacterium]|nr:class I SAM-dependent methyltransferase [Phycisphaeraceae bacterium]
MNLRNPLYPIKQGVKRVLRAGFRRAMPRVLDLAWRTGVSDFRFPGGLLKTTGRHYLDQFIRECRPDIRGRIMEFGLPYYQSIADPKLVSSYETFDIDPTLKTDHVGDIQDCPHMPDGAFDCIVCTQVLEHVANPFKAAGELKRMLAPGGTLLLTVPASYPYHAVPHDYWRYTPDSLRMLFGDAGDVEVRTYGNRVVVVAAYWKWSAGDVPRHVLDQRDPDYPTIIALRLRKAEALSKAA